MYQTQEPEHDVSRFLRSALGMTPLALAAPASTPVESALPAAGPGALTAYRLGEGIYNLAKGIPEAARYWMPRLMTEPTMPNVPLSQTAAELSTIKPEIAGMISGGLASEAAAQSLGAMGTTPEERLAQAQTTLLKTRPLGGVTPKTLESLTEAGRAGHLGEIARTGPQNYADALAATRDYMNNYFDQTVGPALARKGAVTISLDNVASAVKALHNPSIESVLPERLDAIDRTVARFRGKEMPIADAYKLLGDMNDMSKTVQSMAPAEQAAAEGKNAATESLMKATDALRQTLYSKLDAMGEHGIADAQKQYGQLADVRNFLQKNVVGAAKAEARKPSLSPGSLIMRSFTRRPLLAEAGMGSAMFTPELGAKALLPFATVPVIELLATLKERGMLPNSLLREALGQYAKMPSPELPTIYEPKVKALLPERTAIEPPYRGEPAGSEPTPTGGARRYQMAPQPIPEGQPTGAPPQVNFQAAQAPLTPGDIVTLASRVAREAAGEGAPAAPVAREPIFDISRIRQEEAAMRGPKAGTTISLSPQARELLRQILAGKK
ncbi:MAG: hypothetical protein KGI66_04210 [Patescibacteria group bacterium]|nr:hypothetical protein [Patescibacteria group bacterium]